MRPPDLLTMSATELDRLNVIERVRDARLSRVDAAKQLGLTPRHISRLVNAFERDGATALVSKRRGRRSNHAYADAVKTRVLGLVREFYADFGLTYKHVNRRAPHAELASCAERAGRASINCR